jgi:uncharacterized cupredoxin-like copper-binding protein
LGAGQCGPKSVNAVLTEDYHIELDNSSAKAGDITFHIDNQAATVEHEFVVVQTDLASGDLPVGDDGNVPEDDVTIIDEQEALQPGDVSDLTVNLPPGHYVLMCNLPGHYLLGMHTDFTVE